MFSISNEASVARAPPIIHSRHTVPEGTKRMVSIGLSSATVAVQFSGPSCEELRFSGDVNTRSYTSHHGPKISREATTISLHRPTTSSAITGICGAARVGVA